MGLQDQELLDTVGSDVYRDRYRGHEILHRDHRTFLFFVEVKWMLVEIPESSSDEQPQKLPLPQNASARDANAHVYWSAPYTDQNTTHRTRSYLDGLRDGSLTTTLPAPLEYFGRASFGDVPHGCPYHLPGELCQPRS